MPAEILFRCSAIGHLMTEPVQVDDCYRTPDVDKIIAKKVRTDDEKAILAALKLRTLSVGAKTYIRSLAAQSIFGVDFEVSSKYMEKGNRCESDSIALLNSVRGLALSKNSERKSNDFLAGECDLFDAARKRGHDLKTSWSIATFPICETDCLDKLYEYQMRGYMWLWDADEWEVNYALVNTPEDLIGYEPMTLHFVDHIPANHRVTTWVVQRDAAKEAQIAEKVKAARIYYAEVIAEFDRTHRAALSAVDESEAKNG